MLGARGATYYADSVICLKDGKVVVEKDRFTRPGTVLDPKELADWIGKRAGLVMVLTGAE